jgi:type IV fimbrial biogenesis protein FimT
MLNRRHIPQGFSLIELMLAIAVLAILTTLAFPSYKAWIQNTRIKTTAASILNGLQVARSEAVRRNASVKFVLGANPDGTTPCLGGGGTSCWNVGCVFVVADPVPPAVTPPGCPASIQSRSSSEGSTANIIVALYDATGTLAPGNTTVAFTSLGGLAAAPAPFAWTDVSVSPTVLPAAQSTPLRVTLGTGGNARMCNPNASIPTSDPRHC